MSKPQVSSKEFLERSEEVLEPKSALDELKGILERENIRQIKKHLAADLEPLNARLASIEAQQKTIISLLKSKLDFDPQEKRVLDMLEKLIAKEL
jgi:hypothetical protein